MVPILKSLVKLWICKFASKSIEIVTTIILFKLLIAANFICITFLIHLFVIWDTVLFSEYISNSLKKQRMKSFFWKSCLKFTYSEKATKLCEISINYLSYVLPVKWLLEISQNLVAFSEHMNFTYKNFHVPWLFKQRVGLFVTNYKQEVV